MPDLEGLVAAARDGGLPTVVLVAGDRVLSEPAALRVAEAAAERGACAVQVYRRPSTLGPILEDLRTFSLFQSAKVALVVESSVLADARAAADLVDQVIDVLPVSGASQLSEREREAAGRLLQVLHLFGIQPEASSPEAVVAGLPSWCLAGGTAMRRKRQGRGRSKKQVQEVQEGLAVLLDSALEAGLQGWAQSDLAVLGELVERGLPDSHLLVLAESSVASEHPLVERLRAGGALVAVGNVSTDRRGHISGLDRVARELERETGVGIERPALDELARRTLRKTRDSGVDATSTARLAAEYRKLAVLADAKRIGLDLVCDVVEDRGEEDVWALLDDLGAGKISAALTRVRRLLMGASDPVAARLSLFALLSDFGSRLLSVHSLIVCGSVSPGERNYRRFEGREAKLLQGELPGGHESPLAGLHPFRLHRIYLAASRLRNQRLDGLPAAVLDAEIRIKGDSGDPETALCQLVLLLGSGVVDPRSDGEQGLLDRALALAARP